MSYGMAELGEQEIMFTPSYPMDKGERDTWRRLGLLPYAICSRNKDNITYSCSSYDRIGEPMSALFAISAEFSHILSRPNYQNPGWVKRTEELFGAAVGALLPYIGTQPWATGFRELGALFVQGRGQEPEEWGPKIVATLLEKLTETTVGTAVNVPGTWGNWMRKQTDPTIYNTRDLTQEQVEFLRDDLGEMSLPLQAVFRAINKAKLASPYFNPELEEVLNLWGEKMKTPEQGIFSLVKTQDTKYNKVDMWLQKLNYGISMPTAHYQGIDLSAEEYNFLIRAMNEPSKRNRRKTMLQEMGEKMDKKSWLNSSYEDKLTELNMIKHKRLKVAKQELITAYPNLSSFVSSKELDFEMKSIELDR